MSLFMAAGVRGGFELPTPEEVVGRVKEVYSRHCCFQASFDQLTVNVAMDMRDRFEGKMYVKKPGSIALDVESPEKQKVVIKGRSYTVYFPEEGNSVQGEVPPEINVEHFFSFFANIGNIDRNFSINFPPKAYSPEEELVFLELTDRANPRSTYRIILGIDSKGYVVRRAIIYDALGNYNRFDLSAITFLDSIPDSQFRIDQRSPRSEAPLGLPFLKDSDTQ